MSRICDFRICALTEGCRSSAHPTPTIGESKGALTELRIHLDGSVSVFQRLWQSRQLSIRICSVIVPPGIVRVPLDTFRVSLDGTSEITLLEQGVSFLPRLRRLLRIDIRKLLGLGLVTFGLTELIEDIWSSVFRERLVEVLDGRSQVPGLGVSASNTPVSLGNKFVVCPDLGR